MSFKGVEKMVALRFRSDLNIHVERGEAFMLALFRKRTSVGGGTGHFSCYDPQVFFIMADDGICPPTRVDDVRLVIHRTQKPLLMRAAVFGGSFFIQRAAAFCFVRAKIIGEFDERLFPFPRQVKVHVLKAEVGAELLVFVITLDI